MPYGGAAANCLGLTTQNPVRVVYLTSGPNRRLHFGSSIVELRHAPRWQLVAPHRKAGNVIRALAWLGPAEVEDGLEAVLPTLSEADRDELAVARAVMPIWMAEPVSARLVEWVRDHACGIVEEGLSRTGFAARIRAEGDRLYTGYEPLLEETGFVRPEVMVEFGARSTGEPHKTMPVLCDAAALLPDLAFPETRPNVMLAKRTFWEKATAIHVFCSQARRRGQRLSRHWHDLARLDAAGIAANALADYALAISVARHKAMFFTENDAHGDRNDYEAAVSGGLHLVPSGAAHAVLADDYARMLADGMLLDENEPFDALMERCAAIEARANGPRPRDS